MLLFFLLTFLPLYAMNYQKSEFFYVGGWVREKVKCLGNFVSLSITK